MISISRRFPLPILLGLSLVCGGCSASEGQKAAAQGAALYDQGDYEAALPLLEKAASQGASDGQLEYQLAYIYDTKGEHDKALAAREKAEPLLVKRMASKKATLEDIYYLTAVYAGLQRPAQMKSTADEGIKRFGQRTDLSGEDLFRLGRLYQFAGNAAQSAASYRKAADTMGAAKDPNRILYSLALAADAGADLKARRYPEAAEKLEKAEALNPKNPPSPYSIALAELGAGLFDKARSRFATVREEATATEAQYGADVAAHLQSCGGLAKESAEGKPVSEMDNVALQESLTAAATAYREAKSADPAAPEKLQAAERWFFTLAAECMLRGSSIRDLSISGNYADLIRR
jgi:hypothetical protein